MQREQQVPRPSSHRRRVLEDISMPSSQTRLPGPIVVPDPSTPMVVVHHIPPTPPEKRTVFSPAKSPPRRSPRISVRWVPVTPPPSNEREGFTSRSRSRSRSPSSDSAPTTPRGTREFSPDGLRRSPRKRLVYFPEDPPNNPPTPKKVKFVFSPRPSPPMKATLHSLSNLQLITIIGNIAEKHPEIVPEIVSMIPAPNLKPVYAHIKHLRYCVHKALPKPTTSRLQSRSDSVAFARTEVHIYNLKKYVFDTGAKLERSQHWGSVVDYAMMAWNSVRMTPVWDRPIHNETRDLCYDYLSGLLQRAISQGNFTHSELLQIQRETSLIERDSPCFVQLTAALAEKVQQE